MNGVASSQRLFTSFKAKLVLLVLLAVLPLFGLALWQNFKQRETEKARATGEITALANLIAANQSGFIRNASQLLATLSGFAPLVSGEDRRVSEVHLQNLLKLAPDYRNFGLINRDGTLFVSAVEAELKNSNFSDRSYFQRVLRTKRFAIGDFQIGRITGEPSLNFAYPILDERGEVHRVLFAALKLEVLSEAASRIELPKGGTVTILDSGGTVVVRLPNAEGWVGKSVSNFELARQAVKSDEGVFEAPGLDKIDRLYSVSTITDGQSPSVYVLAGVPTELLFKETNAALVQSLFLLSIVTAGVLAASRWLAEQSILRPVRALVDSANRLANSEYSTRVRLENGAAELHELERAFNSMAENLEKRQKELDVATANIRQMNLELEDKVQERTAQLTAAVHELESFSYSVSHDLRAPLRHLDGFAQLLEQNQYDRLDEKGRRHVKVITQAAKKMGRLIDDLLLFSRMGRQEMMKADCDLNRLVREVISELQGETEKRVIEWVIPDLPTVYADAAMLKQALLNLFSNAIKYTRPRNPARIEFGWRTESPKLGVFFLKDNGVGFDMRFSKKLFGVFQRLHLESEFEGTGVGLANVRRIISRHGGETWAESEVGEGATFYFTLPLNESI